MQTIEPFGSYDDEWQPTTHSVKVKEGIDLVQLRSGVGTEFEVDPSVPLPGGGREEENCKAFDREEVLQHLNFDCLDLGRDGDSDSESESDSPFQRLASQMEDLSGDGGVLKRQLHAGIGEGVPERALVRVHYNGYLEYADEPYDSSRLRGKQQQFVLGNGEVIPGWEVAVKSMLRNERSQFLISPEYAFGEMGCPPRIPPKATILFEIELLGFVDYRAAEDLADMRDQQRTITFQQRLAAANSEREAGNDLFQQNMIGRAISKYLKAVRQLEAVRLKNEEEEEVWRYSLKKLYLNLSLCNLKQRKSQLALSNCRRVLELDNKNVKALFRMGQAHMQLGDFGRSKEYLRRAGKLSPENDEIRQELKKLESAAKQFQAMEKTMYTNMFQQPSKVDPKTGEQEEVVNTAAQVPHYTRNSLLTKLRALKDNSSMLELVLPSTLSQDELTCAEDVAEELGLATEKNPASGLRIFKRGVQPEDFEQYLR